MNPRECWDAFVAREKPQRIPLTIYASLQRGVEADPAWQPMYRDGLRVTHHVPTVRQELRGVEVARTVCTEGGRQVRRETYRTPIGEVWATWADGWNQSFWLKSAADYRVMRWVVEHTEILPDHDGYLARERDMAPLGVPLVYLGRSPLQTILVDYAGLEAFAEHIVELEREVDLLYEALLVNFRSQVELAAQGPGRYVAVLENLTADTLGPARYRKYHLPVYGELFPMLERAGKVVGTHYDGRLGGLRDLIQRSPIDAIESLTGPPEGDMTLREARAAWPDKLLWVNINVASYALPPAELRACVLDLVRAGAPDGRRLAFEISEDLPFNWRESIPVVLGALAELAG